MSTLRVRVDKLVDSEGSPPPRVFARIERLDDRGRAVRDTLQHVLVPISHHPDQVEAISLDPGRYAVEVKLPSGEWLSDAVRVSADGTQDLVLAGAQADREWRPWQQASASVRLPHLSTKSSRAPASSASRPRTPQTKAESGGATRGGGVSRGLGDRVALVLERVGLQMVRGGALRSRRADVVTPWEPELPAQVEAARPLYWLSGGPAGLAVDVLRQDPWNALPVLRGSTAHIVEALNAGRSARLVEPAGGDDASAVFPVPNLAGATGFAPTERTYAAVHRRTGVELVCLPTPWVDQWTNREVGVDVSVARPRLESEFASSILVRDPQLSVLLGFLSSGALPSAKRLAETAGEMLYEKTVNPLAAAAGAYALVSSVADTAHERWHDWVEHLMRRFEYVPDGAIQYATLRLRLRSSESDLAQATDAFKRAYRRGLPYFGLGVRWLLEGLQHVGTRDAEAKTMAESVQRLAARLHPQSPFTILRLGRQ